VLQLVTGSSPVSVVKTGAQAKKEDSDDEEWNW